MRYEQKAELQDSNKARMYEEMTKLFFTQQVEKVLIKNKKTILKMVLVLQKTRLQK